MTADDLSIDTDTRPKRLLPRTREAMMADTDLDEEFVETRPTPPPLAAGVLCTALTGVAPPYLTTALRDHGKGCWECTDGDGRTADQLFPVANERGVRVALDVLARLHNPAANHGYYPGRYLYVDTPITVLEADGVKYDDDGVADLQKYVDQSQCTYCLLGSCLLSKIRLYDAVKSYVSAYDDQFAFWKRWSNAQCYEDLADVFDETTLALMECAFERRMMGRAPIASASGRQAVRAAIRRFGAGLISLRVENVVLNVLRHGGAFWPEKEPSDAND